MDAVSFGFYSSIPAGIMAAHDFSCSGIYCKSYMEDVGRRMHDIRTDRGEPDFKISIDAGTLTRSQGRHFLGTRQAVIDTIDAYLGKVYIPEDRENQGYQNEKHGGIPDCICVSTYKATSEDLVKSHLSPPALEALRLMIEAIPRIASHGAFSGHEFASVSSYAKKAEKAATALQHTNHFGEVRNPTTPNITRIYGACRENLKQDDASIVWLASEVSGEEIASVITSYYNDAGARSSTYLGIANSVGMAQRVGGSKKSLLIAEGSTLTNQVFTNQIIGPKRGKFWD